MYTVVPRNVWVGRAHLPRSLKQSWRVVDANQLPDHFSDIVPRSAVAAWCNDEAQANIICGFLNGQRTHANGLVEAERDSLRISYEREARERKALEKDRDEWKERATKRSYLAPVAMVCNEDSKIETVTSILNRVLEYKREIAQLIDCLRDARAERKQAGDDYRAALNTAYKQRDEARADRNHYAETLTRVAAERDKYKAVVDACHLKDTAGDVKQGGNYADSYYETLKTSATRAAEWATDLQHVKNGVLSAVEAIDRRVTALEAKPTYGPAPTIPGSIAAIRNAIHDMLYRMCPTSFRWSTRSQEMFGVHEITLTLEG